MNNFTQKLIYISIVLASLFVIEYFIILSKILIHRIIDVWEIVAINVTKMVGILLIILFIISIIIVLLHHNKILKRLFDKIFNTANKYSSFFKVIFLIIFMIVFQFFLISTFSKSKFIALNPNKLADKIEKYLVIYSLNNSLCVPVFYLFPKDVCASFSSSGLDKEIKSFYDKIDEELEIKFEPRFEYCSNEAEFEKYNKEVKSQYNNLIEIVIERDSINDKYLMSLKNYGNVYNWISYKKEIELPENEFQDKFATNISPLIYFSFAQFMFSFNKNESANDYYFKILNTIGTTIFTDKESLSKLYYYISLNYKNWNDLDPSPDYFNMGFEFINKAKEMVDINNNERIYALYMIYAYNSFDNNILLGRKEYYPEETICRNLKYFLEFRS